MDRRRRPGGRRPGQRARRRRRRQRRRLRRRGHRRSAVRRRADRRRPGVALPRLGRRPRRDAGDDLGVGPGGRAPRLRRGDHRGRRRRRVRRRGGRRQRLRRRAVERGVGARLPGLGVRCGRVPLLVGPERPLRRLLRGRRGARRRRQRRRLRGPARRLAAVQQRPRERGRRLAVPRLGHGAAGRAGLDLRAGLGRRGARQLGRGGRRRERGRLRRRRRRHAGGERGLRLPLPRIRRRAVDRPRLVSLD